MQQNSYSLYPQTGMLHDSCYLMQFAIYYRYQSLMIECKTPLQKSYVNCIHCQSQVMEYYEKKARTVIVTGFLHTAQVVISRAHFTQVTICPHGKNTTANSPL